MENLKSQKLQQAIFLIAGILQQHSLLYKRYLSVLKEEQKLLVNRKVEQFDNMLIIKEKLVDSLVAKDEERIEILDSVSFIFGVKDGKDIKIKHLAEKAEKKYRDILIKTKMELDQVLTEVKVVNKINEDLLNNSINFVKKVFETVAGKKEQNNTYCNTGSINTSINYKRSLINTQG